MAVVCIAGRPNVGKSTLFNRFLRRRTAITDSTPGVTRDALRRSVLIRDIPVTLIDTGGIGEGEEELTRAVYARSVEEINRADVVLLILDVTEVTGEDEELIKLVRRSSTPAILVVNKVDNQDRDLSVSEFWQFGISPVVSISAAHGLGMEDLEDAIMPYLEDANRTGEVSEEQETESEALRLAIVGQPNTGKSSLLNRLLQEDRALVSDIAGTTRDTVEGAFQYKDTHFSVVDTAGIRRKSRVNESLEYYAVQRALDAIDEAQVVILMIDATKGLSEQDKKIASRVAERGRGVVVALNKWDLLNDTGNQLNALTDRIHFLFPVFQHVPILPLSAHTGEGVSRLLQMLVHIRQELNRRVDTGPLNQAVRRWVTETPPPQGKRPIKVRYMTQVSANPVRFILFTNRKKIFPEFYQRFLMNRIREEFGFHHIPFFLEIRE
jgi:GTP-binding protein